MAGFALHVTQFLSKPYVKIGFFKIKGRRRPVRPGYLETTYLENFVSKDKVECRSPENEVCFQVMMFVVLVIVNIKNLKCFKITIINDVVTKNFF